MTDETKTPSTEPEQPNDEPAPEEVSSSESAESTTAVATADEDTGEEQADDKEIKIEQTVDIEDVGPCKKHIKVTVERASIDDRLNEKFSELVKDAVVPGFRKGKAPRRVIERQFNKDVGLQVKGEILMASLEQLGEDFDIAPLSAPDLKPDKIELPTKGPMVYEFDVEVRPEFDLPDYKGIKLKRPVKEFTEEDIDREMRRILAEYGQLVPKDGPAELDDFVIVDMQTRYDNRVIGQANELTLRVDERLAFKDGVAENFAEQIVGAVAGDSREVDITMSDRVATAALAGRTLQATVVINDVKKLRLPDLTHEFLHTFGVHSEDQLREMVLALLERRLAYQQRQSARQQILQTIGGASEWQLPEDLLIRQARQTMSRRVMEMRDAGMNEQEIEARVRMMQQDVVKSTALSLKEHFVLQKVAEEEKLDVSDEEIDEEIEAMAEEAEESPRRLRARLEREDSMESLAGLLIEQKALNLILENAEYEDVPLDKKDEDASMALSEEQAVSGEMRDPTEVPPEEESDDGDDSKAETADEDAKS